MASRVPLAKLDPLLGYGIAFALFAALQASITLAVAFGLLDLPSQGPVWAVVLLAILNAVLGMALGLLVSAFAASEFQAVQFMPAVVFPQMLLSGLFAPRDTMPRALELVSDVLPFTYAYDALARIARDDTGAGLWISVGVVCGSILLALGFGAATLRRRTA
jgi:ABC-2 type transport system permease protein